MEIDGGHVVPGIMDEQPRYEQTQQRGCCRGRQYSSASMIVITRSVTDGSVGSGEWYVSVLSK
jgi:hypothetical protein